MRPYIAALLLLVGATGCTGNRTVNESECKTRQIILSNPLGKKGLFDDEQTSIGTLSVFRSVPNGNPTCSYLYWAEFSPTSNDGFEVSIRGDQGGLLTAKGNRLPATTSALKATAGKSKTVVACVTYNTPLPSTYCTPPLSVPKQ